MTTPEVDVVASVLSRFVRRLSWDFLGERRRDEFAAPEAGRAVGAFVTAEQEDRCGLIGLQRIEPLGDQKEDKSTESGEEDADRGLPEEENDRESQYGEKSQKHPITAGRPRYGLAAGGERRLRRVDHSGPSVIDASGATQGIQRGVTTPPTLLASADARSRVKFKAIIARQRRRLGVNRVDRSPDDPRPLPPLIVAERRTFDGLRPLQLGLR